MRISDWSSDVCSSDFHADGASRTADLRYRLQGGPLCGAKEIRAEVDGRNAVTELRDEGVISDRVDQRGDDASVELIAVGQALAFRPHGSAHRNKAPVGISLRDLGSEKADERRPGHTVLKITRG